MSNGIGAAVVMGLVAAAFTMLMTSTTVLTYAAWLIGILGLAGLAELAFRYWNFK